MKKAILILLLLFVVLGIAVGYYFFQKPVSSLAGADAVGNFTSTEIFQDFENDEKAATEKCAGSVYEVTGEIIEIIQNTDSSTTLLLESGDPIFGVKCRLDPKETPSELPAVGDRINIKGLCIGYNSDVELNQCIILNPSKS